MPNCANQHQADDSVKLNFKLKWSLKHRQTFVLRKILQYTVPWFSSPLAFITVKTDIQKISNGLGQSPKGTSVTISGAWISQSGSRWQAGMILYINLLRIYVTICWDNWPPNTILDFNAIQLEADGVSKFIILGDSGLFIVTFARKMLLEVIDILCS